MDVDWTLQALPQKDKVIWVTVCEWLQRCAYLLRSAPCSPGPKPSLSTPVLQHPPLAPAVPGLTHSVPDSDNLSTLKPLFLCIGWCVCVCVCVVSLPDLLSLCVFVCCVYMLWQVLLSLNVTRPIRKGSKWKVARKRNRPTLLRHWRSTLCSLSLFLSFVIHAATTHSCYYVWTNIAHKILS